MAYFPNGSAGEVLDMQCMDCPLGYGWDLPGEPQREIGLPCPVAAVQLMFNYDQIDIPKLRDAMTILVSDDGVCQTRALLLQVRDGEKQQ